MCFSYDYKNENIYLSPRNVGGTAWLTCNYTGIIASLLDKVLLK